MHGVDVDVYRAFDASSPGFLHSPPVGERFGHQFVSRYGGDGFVPVLHFHGGEVNLYHVAVGVAAGHHDPVADVHHAVGD